MTKLSILLLAVCALFIPELSMASASMLEGEVLDLTTSTVGIASVVIFVVAYILVMTEEMSHLRKSKPVIIAAGLIWAIIGYTYTQMGQSHLAEEAVRHNLLEYAELFLFLLVAMTYINSMEERQVFSALRSWLIRKKFSLRKLFWMTGILAFFISPVADNLTTALIMCAVVMAVGGDNKKFVAVACVNIVVAANAGGAFSPFGDITTLMVWQKGTVQFTEFFALFLPSVVNFVVPAAIMSLTVPLTLPDGDDEIVVLLPGALPIVGLFLMTIVTAVTFHSAFGLPPALGMMMGLGYLQFFGYYLKMSQKRTIRDGGTIGDVVAFDVFQKVARAEWDTLLFFYGVVLAVGGLGFLGYLSVASDLMYNQLGPTTANILVGILSAIVDNIPVMFAVLTMEPTMDLSQWLLVTLTAGVGGSLLSIGSAAGVALMGQAKGAYTFGSHLKWTPVIALGYAASIGVHIPLNF